MRGEAGRGPQNCLACAVLQAQKKSKIREKKRKDEANCSILKTSVHQYYARLPQNFLRTTGKQKSEEGVKASNKLQKDNVAARDRGAKGKFGEMGLTELH